MSATNFDWTDLSERIANECDRSGFMTMGQMLVMRRSQKVFHPTMQANHETPEERLLRFTGCLGLFCRGSLFYGDSPHYGREASFIPALMTALDEVEAIAFRDALNLPDDQLSGRFLESYDSWGHYWHPEDGEPQELAMILNRCQCLGLARLGGVASLARHLGLNRLDIEKAFRGFVKCS